MARYELSEGTSNKFWDIVIAGKVLVLTWGKIGASSVSTTRKSWPDAAAAQKQHDKLVREKLAKGYTAVGGKAGKAGKPGKPARPAPAAPVVASDKKLEDTILADPDDPQPYLVYADWLQTQGDPRGELITLQHQAEVTSAPAKQKALAKLANEYLKRHADAFLGPLRAFITKDKYGGKRHTAEWHCGFIRKLVIGWGMYDEGGDEESATAELVEILEHPSMRFCTELELGPAPTDEEMDLQCLVDAMIKTKRPAALRSLYLGHTSDWDISGTATGDFGAIAKHFKRLRKVTLEGGNVTIGKLDLPELTEFAVHTGGLTTAEIKQICTASWPRLERLEIWFGDPNYGASGELKHIKSILAGDGLSKLRHLGLKNCAWVDDIAKALPTSKILPQLRTLDLGMGTLSDQGLAVLAAHASAFHHLDQINVDDNALGEASLPVLRKLGKKWISKRQSPDRIPPAGEDGRWRRRYVSVGE